MFGKRDQQTTYVFWMFYLQYFLKQGAFLLLARLVDQAKQGGLAARRVFLILLPPLADAE